MRRTAVLLTVLSTLGVLPHVSAAPPEGPFQSVFEIADASWFLREGGKPFMIVAGAYRSTDPAGGARTYAFADRIKCWEKRTKRFGITFCFGSIRARKIAAESLDFDPLLNETSLSFGKNRISWEGRGDYTPDVFPIADTEFGAAAYASIDRAARAEGKVLGLDLRTRGWKDWGYLSEGFFGGVLTTKNGKVVYEDDGTITYKMRFRRAL